MKNTFALALALLGAFAFAAPTTNSPLEVSSYQTYYTQDLPAQDDE
jgi:hypothetical protein